jgi:hypothetical protein
MNNLKGFLRVLEKFGYPNEKFESLSKFSGYNPDEFLENLMEQLGEDKTLNFIGKTFDKLSDGNKGIFVPLWLPEEFVYLIINNYHVDLDETSCVIIDWDWGDSKIFDEFKKDWVTLEQINVAEDNWEVEDFYDAVKEKVSDFTHSRTGFCLQWGI